MMVFALLGRFFKHPSETQGVSPGYWAFVPVGALLMNAFET